MVPKGKQILFAATIKPWRRAPAEHSIQSPPVTTSRPESGDIRRKSLANLIGQEPGDSTCKCLLHTGSIAGENTGDKNQAEDACANKMDTQFKADSVQDKNQINFLCFIFNEFGSTPVFISKRKSRQVQPMAQNFLQKQSSVQLILRDPLL